MVYKKPIYIGTPSGGDHWYDRMAAMNKNNDNFKAPSAGVDIKEVKYDLTKIPVLPRPGVNVRYIDKDVEDAAMYQFAAAGIPVEKGDTLYEVAIKPVAKAAATTNEEVGRIAARVLSKVFVDYYPKGVSMGCKIPFDKCSVCGQEEKGDGMVLKQEHRKYQREEALRSMTDGDLKNQYEMYHYTGSNRLGRLSGPQRNKMINNIIDTEFPKEEVTVRSILGDTYAGMSADTIFDDVLFNVSTTKTAQDLGLGECTSYSSKSAALAICLRRFDAYPSVIRDAFGGNDASAMRQLLLAAPRALVRSYALNRLDALSPEVSSKYHDEKLNHDIGLSIAMVDYTIDHDCAILPNFISSDAEPILAKALMYAGRSRLQKFLSRHGYEYIFAKYDPAPFIYAYWTMHVLRGGSLKRFSTSEEYVSACSNVFGDIPKCFGNESDHQEQSGQHTCSDCKHHVSCGIASGDIEDLGLDTRNKPMDPAGLPSRITDTLLRCGVCPYAKTVGGGRWKPPVANLWECPFADEDNETIHYDKTPCERGHTTAMYTQERYGSNKKQNPHARVHLPTEQLPKFVKMSKVRLGIPKQEDEWVFIQDNPIRFLNISFVMDNDSDKKD